jgi:hypothetical protein
MGYNNNLEDITENERCVYTNYTHSHRLIITQNKKNFKIRGVFLLIIRIKPLDLSQNLKICYSKLIDNKKRIDKLPKNMHKITFEAKAYIR